MDEQPGSKVSRVGCGYASGMSSTWLWLTSLSHTCCYYSYASYYLHMRIFVPSSSSPLLSSLLLLLSASDLLPRLTNSFAPFIIIFEFNWYTIINTSTSKFERKKQPSHDSSSVIEQIQNSMKFYIEIYRFWTSIKLDQTRENLIKIKIEFYQISSNLLIK